MKNLGIIFVSIIIAILPLAFLLRFITVIQKEIFGLCSGESCMDMGLKSGLVFLIVMIPVVFMFIKYLINTIKYPWTKNKKIIVSIVALLIILGNLLLYIDMSAVKYVVEKRYSDRHCFGKEECINKQTKNINSIIFLPIVIKYVEIVKDYRFNSSTYKEYDEII